MESPDRAELCAALRVMAITAGRRRSESASFVFERCRELVDAGVSAIMLREPGRDSREVLALCERIHDEVTLPAGASLIISDRVDVALAIGAEGVHLGFRSLDPSAARRRVRDRMWLGFSLHDPIASQLGAIQSVHYVTFGPVFETPSKQGWVEATGVERLGEVADCLECPVVALGGIDHENSRRLAGTGVAGVAMIRGLWDAPDPRRVVARLEESLF